MSDQRKSKLLNLIDWYEERGFKHPTFQKQKHMDNIKAHLSEISLHIVCENFFENMETLESLLSKMNLDPGCSFNIYDSLDAFVQTRSSYSNSKKVILWWMSSKESNQKDFFQNKFGFSFEIFAEHDINFGDGQNVHLLCSYHPEDWQKTQAYKKDVWLQALKIKSWL